MGRGISTVAGMRRVPPQIVAQQRRAAKTVSGEVTPTVSSADELFGLLEGCFQADLSAAEIASRLERVRSRLGCDQLWLWVRRGPNVAVRAVSGPVPSSEVLDVAFERAIQDSGSQPMSWSQVERHYWVSRLSETGWGIGLGCAESQTPLLVQEPALWIHLEERLSKVPVPEPDVPPTREQVLTRLRFPEGYVVGESLAMQHLYRALLTAVSSRFDVLILGETGTGKELVAQTIHRSGPTAAGPFVAINCAAIPAELLEAQLFGVEGRVATGVDPRPGWITRAEGGTIFLDEVGELPDRLEAKLLRFLQEREILPLGAHQTRKVNVRVIAASNRELGDEVREGRFRADLYYRLSTLQFHLPPLRHRREDIAKLALAFVSRVAGDQGKSILGITKAALQILRDYDWPGNVRELQHATTRAVLVAPDGAFLGPREYGPIAYGLAQQRGEVFERSAPPSATSVPRVPDPGPVLAPSLAARLETVEREEIHRVVQACRGNLSRAARQLGLSRNGLYAKLRRFGLLEDPGDPKR